MRIVIPGGSGQVGTILARAFHADGHDVVVLSRTPGAAPWRVVPGRLAESGFTFRFPEWGKAARDTSARRFAEGTERRSREAVGRSMAPRRTGYGLWAFAGPLRAIRA